MIDTTKFPYDVLEEFGLTPEMIDDLPEHVLETLFSGGRSPLLPIIVKTELGKIKTSAKFRLLPATVEDGKYGVVFYPKLTEAPVGNFTDDQKKCLIAGSVIIADIEIPDSKGHTNNTKCFVQIDRDTNHVFYIPTPVLARNIQGLDEYLNLSSDDMNNLNRGMLVTVEDPQELTIGIDLFTDAGIFVCDGDADNWRKIVGKMLPRYSFGIDGCWVNENGELHYVKDDDFTDDILKIQKDISSKYQVTDDSIMDRHFLNLKEDVNNQITR